MLRFLYPLIIALSLCRAEDREGCIVTKHSDIEGADHELSIQPITGDALNIVDTASECCVKCLAAPGCLAAVFQASERACWLKSSDGPLIASGDDDTAVLTLPQTVTEVRTIDDIASVDALLRDDEYGERKQGEGSSYGEGDAAAEDAAAEAKDDVASMMAELKVLVKKIQAANGGVGIPKKEASELVVAWPCTPALGIRKGSAHRKLLQCDVEVMSSEIFSSSYYDNLKRMRVRHYMLVLRGGGTGV